MNYQQTLDYLYERLPMFSRMGAAAIKKDLGNTRLLCARLSDPQLKFPSIHIAGTNGKGSVSHMLAAILQTAGYKTGLYTSPHLHDFRERIKINGEMVPAEYICRFVESMQASIEEIEPSFFEITVAMAFDYFAQEQVDIAVIETGLGGRLDSTNIIEPVLSVITNIGFDHMNLLGNSLPEIAFEKAGIIKLNTPVVIGESNSLTAPVFEQKSASLGAALYQADHLRYVSGWERKQGLLEATVADPSRPEPQTFELDLTAQYQLKNLLTVLEAVRQLQHLGWKISTSAIKEALRQVKKLTGLHGRWELVHEQPRVILDVAHNEDGLKQVAEQLEAENYRHLRIVIGMVKDKDTDASLRQLPAHASYYFCQASLPRALPAAELSERAAVVGLRGSVHQTVTGALQQALSEAGKEDLILVCGSVFTVAEVQGRHLPA